MIGTLMWGVGALLAVAFVGMSIWATQRVPKWKFETSNVLLTGGSVGIGLETAKALTQRKVRNLVIAARREDVLQEAVRVLEEVKQRTRSTTSIHYVVMDVCKEESVKAGMAAAVRHCNGEPIDLLLCNAGFAHPSRFIDSTMQHARDMMEVNYFGCLNVIWSVLPSMLAQNRGRIVLTSSMAAQAPIAGYTLYAATKSGLRAFAHSLDMENACLGVRVQVISPPDVATPGFDAENLVKSPECRAISAHGGATPFTAEDMASAIVGGIESYRFDITLGSDGYFLGMGTAGMEPATNPLQLMLETLLGGILRFGLVVTSKIHYNIVKDVRVTKATKRS